MLAVVRILLIAGFAMALMLLVACGINSESDKHSPAEDKGLQERAGQVAADDNPATSEGPEVKERVIIGQAHWGTNLGASLSAMVRPPFTIIIGRVTDAKTGWLNPLTLEATGETPPPSHPKASLATHDPGDSNTGTPWSNYTVEVLRVIRATGLRQGDSLIVSQEGGLVDGVAYELEGDRVIMAGSTYLFLLIEAKPGVFTSDPITRFVMGEDGRLRSIDSAWSNLPAVRALTGLTLSEAESKLLTAMAEAAP